MPRVKSRKRGMILYRFRVDRIVDVGDLWVFQVGYTNVHCEHVNHRKVARKPCNSLSDLMADILNPEEPTFAVLTAAQRAGLTTRS